MLKISGLNAPSGLIVTQPGADAMLAVNATGDTVTLQGVGMSAIDTSADFDFT